MKSYNTLVIIIYILTSSTLYGQVRCVIENEVILRQSQLDSFSILYPDCTDLESIQLLTPNVKDLTALGNLKNIGSLIIRNTAISNLNGLDNLERCGYLALTKNDSLSDIKALSKLRHSKTISLVENNVLISLEGFALDSVNWLVIQSKTLKTLKRLGARYCQRLTLIETYLDDFSGHNLSYVEEVVLDITGNIDSIGSINPEKLSILFSPQLQDITPLNSLTKLKWLEISTNKNLSLCSVDIICRNLDNPDFRLDVSGNARRCRNKEEIREGCISSIGSIIETNRINISPQPATDVLNISGLSEDTPYMIINMIGDQVMSGMAYETIDMSSLPAGMYVLQLFDKTKQSFFNSIKVGKL